MTVYELMEVVWGWDRTHTDWVERRPVWAGWTDLGRYYAARSIRGVHQAGVDVIDGVTRTSFVVHDRRVFQQAAVELRRRFTAGEFKMTWAPL